MQRNVNKEDWIAMFRAVGLNDETMTKWHQQFEERHPEGHAEFLNWLGLSSPEIAKVRKLYYLICKFGGCKCGHRALVRVRT